VLPVCYLCVTCVLPVCYLCVTCVLPVCYLCYLLAGVSGCIESRGRPGAIKAAVDAAL